MRKSNMAQSLEAAAAQDWEDQLGALLVVFIFGHCQYLTRDAALAGFGCIAVPAGLAGKEVS